MTCLLCAGCGEFRLASQITPSPTLLKTPDQITLDTLVCKDKAKTESQTAADQARGFMLGFTLSVFGAAIDYEQQKKDQRRIFKECMEARGYSVAPPPD